MQQSWHNLMAENTKIYIILNKEVLSEFSNHIVTSVKPVYIFTTTI